MRQRLSFFKSIDRSDHVDTDFEADIVIVTKIPLFMPSYYRVTPIWSKQGREIHYETRFLKRSDFTTEEGGKVLKLITVF